MIQNEHHLKTHDLKKLGDPELWRQNRSTSKAPNKQLLILPWKKLNLRVWHKTRSLPKIQIAKLLITSFWRKKNDDETKNLTPYRKHFKDSKWAIQKTIVPRKTLNPESWDQIRLISMIQNEHHLKTYDLKKLGDPELWRQNRSTSKAPNKQLLILPWRKLNPRVWHKTRSLPKIQIAKLLITSFWKKNDDETKNLQPYRKHFKDSKWAK